METGAQRCLRVAGALADLAGQESAAIAAGDFPAVLALQDRAAPLVEFLCLHAAAPGSDAALNTRIAAVRELRAHSSARLAGEIARARAELQEVGLARRQVARIAPAYGRAAVGPRQLCAVR